MWIIVYFNQLVSLVACFFEAEINPSGSCQLSCVILSAAWSCPTNCEIQVKLITQMMMNFCTLLNFGAPDGSCVSGALGWCDWAAAAFPGTGRYWGRSCSYGPSQWRTGGSIPAFDTHLPRQTGIGRSKASYLTGMISRDVGKIAQTVMWSSVLLLYLQNPAFCTLWTSHSLEKKSHEYLSRSDIWYLMLRLAQYNIW